MTHNEKDGWENPLSYIQTTIQMRQEDNLLRVHFCGSYWLNDICFTFYLGQILPSIPGVLKPKMITIESDACETGQFPTADLGCRGELSIIDPQTGYKLKLTGAAKKQRIKKSKRISSKRSGIHADTVEKEVDITVRKNIRTQRTDVELIKNTIEKIAKKVYAEHGVTLVRKLGATITRDTITVTQAYNLYHTKFFEERSLGRKKLSFRTLEQYKSTLKTLCYAFPSNISMGDIRHSQLVELFKEMRSNNFEKGLLRSFWDFCRQNGYCKDTDPFSKPTGRKKRTPDTLQQNSVTPESLTLDDCNKVFFQCMDQVEHTGMACAIALTLFGGFSTDECLKKKWGDVIFNADNPDDVRIQHRNDAAAGATHARTRPLLIQGARILTKHYHQLLGIYSAEDLSDMPIVTVKNKKQTPASSKLTQYYETILRQSGIATGEYSAIKEGREAVSKRLFRNTYTHLVDYECGLQKEFGMREYLKGNSLTKNTSADHYIGYSSDDGLLAMAELLRRIGPDEKHMKSDIQKVEDNDGVTYVCPPTSDARQSGLYAEIIIPPGAVISIYAPHGVSGSLVCESVSQTTKRNKRSSKKDGAPTLVPNDGQDSFTPEKKDRPNKKQKTQLRERNKKLKNHTVPTTGSTEIQHNDLFSEGEQLSLF